MNQSSNQQKPKPETRPEKEREQMKNENEKIIFKQIPEEIYLDLENMPVSSEPSEIDFDLSKLPPAPPEITIL